MKKPLNVSREGIPGEVKNAIDLLPCDDFTKSLWTAVSAFETGYWRANIFSQTNNLFSMHFTSRDPFTIGTLSGDGGYVAKYGSLADAAKGLIAYFPRLKWDRTNFTSIEDLVSYMKSKNFFGISTTDYVKGVTRTYQALYGV